LDHRVPRVYDEARIELLDAIVGGDYAADEQLPSEEDLREQYGFARGSVRPMLQTLAEPAGVLRVVHGRGQFAEPAERWNALDDEVVAALIRVGDFARVLREVVEARRLAEVPAAGLAAERATPEVVAALRDAVARMDAIVPKQRSAAVAYGEAEADFHAVLLASLGNRFLRRQLLPLQQAMRTAGVTQRRGAKAVPEHRAVADAIAQGDADAARAAMSAHLDAVGAALPKRRPQRS
jgi:GntR family transcriptional repressor for pyruvate dehydrogenase complex